MVPLIVGVAAVDFLPGCGSEPAADEASTSRANLSSARPVPAKHDLDPEWHKHMRDTVPGVGCFSATPPDTVWHQVPCGKAPKVHFAPAIVGGSGGDSMVSTSGLLTAVWGSFPTVSGPGYPDFSPFGAFSLQVNSNTFVTPLCNLSPNPNCMGWQQFIAAASPNCTFGCSGFTEIFMQYWLIGYNRACPSGWESFTDGGVCSGNCCWVNSDSASGAAYPYWNKLQYVKLSGQVINGGINDYVDFYDGNGTLTSVVSGEGQMQLSQGWKSAEFNIFGFADGERVNFPSGTTMSVRLGIIDGTFAAPTCLAGSTTAETNNLSLVPEGCCATGDANNQAITFLQSNASTPPAAPFCLLNTANSLLSPLLN